MTKTEANTSRVCGYGVDLIHHFEFEDLPIEDWKGGFDEDARAQVTDGLGGWTAYSVAGGTCASTLDTTTPYSGVNCLKTSISAWTSGQPRAGRKSKVIPVNVARAYNLSAQIRYLTGSSSKAAVYVECLAADRTTNLGNLTTIAGFTPTNAYVKYSGRIKPSDWPAGTVFVIVRPFQYATQTSEEGSVLFDEVSFKAEGVDRELVFNWNFDPPMQCFKNLFLNVAQRKKNPIDWIDEDGYTHANNRFDNADITPRDEDSRYVSLSFDLVEEAYL
ncbi:MAG: hypothetical protein HZA22_04750 [Nitrospirae bacterium]|nr:hypothetical protein [Nitrospirota bacterium]